MTTVYDLRTHDWSAAYSLPPEEAVVAAYAHDRGDHNTWDYKKYAPLVRHGRWYVFCGDFAAKKEESA